MEISFPFKLRKKKKEVYLKLEDEDLDVILDIPDLSHFDMTSEVECKIYHIICHSSSSTRLRSSKNWIIIIKMHDI